MNILIVITYLVYVIFYITFFIGGCSYLVFFHNEHPAWFIVALALGWSVFSPKQWKELIK